MSPNVKAGGVNESRRVKPVVDSVLLPAGVALLIPAEFGLCAPPKEDVVFCRKEGEFHRVGGEQTVRVAVRVVSATNRDLSARASPGRGPAG